MRAGRQWRVAESGRAQRGFTLLAMLIVVALLAAAASTLATRWADEVRREREQDLLRVGDEIAGAIASYRRASGTAARRYPPALEDLLEDRRAFGTLRHLRQVYPDPVNRGAAWGLVRAPDGGVMGVYSLSVEAPMRRVPVRLRHADLPTAAQYAQWLFVPREDGK